MTAASLRGLSESEEDRAFLQRRVALFSFAIGSAYLAFWLYRLATTLALGSPGALAHPSFIWHLLAAVALLLPWASCRRGVRSTKFISAMEMLGLTLGVFATSVMALYTPLTERPDFILLLALTNVILGRSIFVPCTARGTLMFGVIFGVALLSCVYVGALSLDLQKWSTLYPELRDATPERAAAGITLEIGAWWVLTTALATGTSYVIYGLRRRVRDAEQLGQYRLENKLGEGGMGIVYRASHAFLRRPTAVKLLPPDRAGADNLRRFEQEVQLTASLTHPNTITIFDYGNASSGVFYYAMEYIDGLDLSDLVARSGPQHQGRVVELMRQAASALVEAHGIGLVHRDIKPSNIMVQLLHPHGGAGDCVKVLDFGLVKQVRGEGGIDVTNEASLSGTPQYMAPESITTPETIDARADLYALGAVTYFLLTGTHVFRGATIVEVCGQHLHSAPEPPSTRLGNPIIPELEQLVLSCLAKDPADRPQSALDLERRLVECSTLAPPWTPENARDWWAVHGVRSESAPSPQSEQVLTVDLHLTSRAGPG